MCVFTLPYQYTEVHCRCCRQDNVYPSKDVHVIIPRTCEYGIDPALSGHRLPLGCPRDFPNQLVQGGSTIVLTALPALVLCSSFVQAQSPTLTWLCPLPRYPSPSSWTVANLENEKHGKYGESGEVRPWLGGQSPWSSCLD